MFLNTSSAIGGLSGGAAWPPTAAMLVTHATAVAPMTTAIVRFVEPFI
jgi:hypothetical protein